MVRGIELDMKKEESKCSTCGYIFNDFEDAQRHFEEKCSVQDQEIRPYNFTAEITISSPAMNQDKARQNIEKWEEGVQDAVGGISFQIENINREGQPE